MKKTLTLKTLLGAGLALAATSVSLSALVSENQVLHFDAAQAVYGEDGVTPAGDGDRVGGWGNQGALGGSVAARPIGMPDELPKTTVTTAPVLVKNALNGHPIIRFNRSENNLLGLDYLETPELRTHLNTDTITWTFVVKMTEAASNNQWIVNYHFEGGDFPYGDLNSLVPSTARRLSANMKNDSGQTRPADPAAVVSENDWYIVSVVWDGPNSTLTQYVDGVQTGQVTSGATRTLLNWVYLGIGNRYQGTRPFGGDIAEFVLYNAALSDADRLANERELALKYGLQPNASMPLAADFGQVRGVSVAGHLTGADYVLDTARTGISPFIDDDLTDEVVPAGDADRVRQWRNSSPLGDQIYLRQDRPANRPTYVAEALNGHPALRFDRHARQQLLIERTDAETFEEQLDTNTVTWTFVSKSTDKGPGNQWISALHFDGGDGPWGDVVTMLTSSGQMGSNMRDPNHALRDAPPNFTFENDTWMIVSLVWDGENGNITQYVNGERTGGRVDTALWNPPGTWKWFSLGSRFNGDRAWSGELAEFVMYNSALSEADRLANERFLGEKFGIEVAGEGEAPTGLVTGSQILHLDPAEGAMTPDPAGLGGIVSLPSELEGKLAIRTANAQSNWAADELYLGFEVDRPLTVYVANDGSNQPAWLTNRFTKTAMTIGTTAGSFDVWERSVGARDYVVLPGNGGLADDYNYFVILSEGPEIITEAPDYFLSAPDSDWSIGKHHWQITADPDDALHTASLVTSVPNFNSENGFKLATNFRVPQLQDDGQNSFGLLLLGDFVYAAGGFSLDSSKGIRAEWLPRQAGGGSTLRLVDQATGTVIAGPNASATWNGEVPTRTSDWTAGDSQIALDFWDSRAGTPENPVPPAPYFLNDSEKVIVRMPDGLDPSFMMEGIRTDNDLANTSPSFLQFTVTSGDPSDGNPGTTVFVAWDIRNSGYEPSWLTDDFTATDYYVEVSSAARYHRLWAREYGEGALVTLPGASYGGGGPYPAGTDNYFVILGDARPGLESDYRLEAEGSFADGVWTLTATLTDGNGFSETVTGTVAGPLSGQNVFGLAVRHLDGNGVTPIWRPYDLTLDYQTAPTLEGFAAWRDSAFNEQQLADPEISGPAAAPAGDGVSNLLKYALGFVNPFVPVSSADLPQMSIDGEGNLVLVYSERTDIDDVEYIPEVSVDLTNWEQGDLWIDEFFRDSDGGNFEEVGVKGLLPEDAGRGFIRLRVEQKN